MSLRAVVTSEGREGSREGGVDEGEEEEGEEEEEEEDAARKERKYSNTWTGSGFSLVDLLGGGDKGADVSAEEERGRKRR